MQHNQQLPNGETIHYYQNLPTKPSENQKPVLIFIHGNNGNGQWWLDTVCHPSLQQYQRISIDLRGFGKSTYNKICESLEDWAEDVGLFIKAKKLKSVNLIGWSFGGAISMKTAQMFPEYINKIIPTCSVSHLGYFAPGDDGRQFYSKQQLAQIPALAFFLKLKRQNDRKAMRDRNDKYLYAKMQDYPEEKKDMLLNGCFQQKSYIDVLSAIRKPNIQFEKIKAKSLMIHGTEDLVIKLDDAQKTGEILGIQIWENHGHMIPVENIDRYAHRLVKFFDQK